MRTRRFVVTTLAAFAVTRAISVLAAHLLGRPDLTLLHTLTAVWDPRWYQDLAVYGYDDAGDLSSSLRVACPDTIRAGCLPGAPDRHSNLAFFTMFPGAIRLLSSIGLDTRVAGLLIATAASLVAAVFVALIARDVADERTGLIAVVLWGALPANVVLSSGRPEPVFIALTASALWLLGRRRLLPAALLAAAAGLTRFQAIALVVPTMVAAWVYPMRWGPRLWVTVVAPSGLVASLAFVANRTGSASGWFDVQREWGSISDGGVAKAAYLGEHLVAGPTVHLVAAWTIVVAIALLVACLALRIPWPLTVYAAILLAGAFVQAYYHQHSMRYLLAAFPLVYPPALWLRRLRPWLTVGILAALLLLSASFQLPLWRSGIDF